MQALRGARLNINHWYTDLLMFQSTGSPRSPTAKTYKNSCLSTKLLYNITIQNSYPLIIKYITPFYPPFLFKIISANPPGKLCVLMVRTYLLKVFLNKRSPLTPKSVLTPQTASVCGCPSIVTSLHYCTLFHANMTFFLQYHIL